MDALSSLFLIFAFIRIASSLWEQLPKIRVQPVVRHQIFFDPRVSVREAEPRAIPFSAAVNQALHHQNPRGRHSRCCSTPLT